MNFVIALSAEAKPIIDYFGMEKLTLPSPFSLFSNDTHQLVISGIGKKNVANAISFLHGRKTVNNLPWLNVGLAGHGSAKIGQIFQVAKFTDKQTEFSGYPPQIFSTSLPKTKLVTCDNPSSEYQAETAYDMEASAFFETAQHFSTNELVQSIKIISDNPQKPVSDFDKSQVRSLIQPSLKLIESLTEEMIVCSDEITEPVENEKIFSEIAQVHHFSETQHYQLKKAIYHARILGMPLNNILQIANESKSPKSLLSDLNKALSAKKIFS